MMLCVAGHHHLRIYITLMSFLLLSCSNADVTDGLVYRGGDWIVVSDLFAQYTLREIDRLCKF